MSLPSKKQKVVSEARCSCPSHVFSSRTTGHDYSSSKVGAASTEI